MFRVEILVIQHVVCHVLAHVSEDVPVNAHRNAMENVKILAWAANYHVLHVLVNAHKHVQYLVDPYVQ